MAVNVIPLYATEIESPLSVTLLVNWCAYGVAELQPGSSRNVATEPCVTHALKIMT